MQYFNKYRAMALQCFDRNDIMQVYDKQKLIKRNYS